MTLEIARRLGQDGVTWETVVVEEDTGGGIPDPSGEPDGDVLTVSSGAAVWSPGGGSQPFFDVLLQHSAAFSNLHTNAPIVPGLAIRGALTLPPTAFGNNGQVNVVVSNPNDFDLQVFGLLIVQNADGTVWIEQDSGTPTTVAAQSGQLIDFDASGGGAGVGLSWSAVNKQVDIANAGAYSAVVSLYAQAVT